MDTRISEPIAFFGALGGLHDARIREITWDPLRRSISVGVADLNANALGLSDYPGLKPGILDFLDVQEVDFSYDAYPDDVQRVYDVQIESAGAKQRCRLQISPGGRLTFAFAVLSLRTS